MPQLDFDTLWDYEHPEHSEAVFRQMLLKEEPNTDLSYHLQLLTFRQKLRPTSTDYNCISEVA